MLNIQKLLHDVFNPQKGENIIILNDYPSSEKKVDMDFIQRREMAQEWHKAFEELAKKVKILAKKLSEAEGALVTFSTGHEVYFDLQKRTAFIDDGDCTKPGQAINFPSGEAYIALYDERGSKTHGFIPVYHENHLLVYEVRENQIIDVVTDSPKSREMQNYFSEDPARANIAELGLGCNEKAVYINNVLQDEKIEGLHWAYGY